jgi:hypothetical protein
MACLNCQTSVKAMFAAGVLVSQLAFADAALAQQPYYYQPAPDYYQNDTAAGTVTGGAFGAITGALLGGRHSRGEGALIGAGVGAVTGNLLGRSKDRADERQAAAGAAVVAQANQQAALQAVTNADLVNMTRAGLGDDVIISAIRSRGARLDLSPYGLISLKQSGVSDRVVMTAQSIASDTGYVAPPTPVVVAPPPPAVIVTPAPYPYYHYRYYGHGPHYHHPHARVHYGVHF